MFPGRCDRCGAGQEWTIFDGVTFVRCVEDCGRQLVIEGFDLPSDSEDRGHAFARSVEGRELGSEWEVVPLVGGAANRSEVGNSALEDPPRAFLDSLWEGDWDASCTT